MTTRETESGSGSPHFRAENRVFCRFLANHCSNNSRSCTKAIKLRTTKQLNTHQPHTHARTLVVWNQELQKHFRDLKSVHCVSYRPRPWRCSLLAACCHSQSLSCFPPPSTLPHTLARSLSGTLSPPPLPPPPPPPPPPAPSSVRLKKRASKADPKRRTRLQLISARRPAPSANQEAERREEKGGVRGTA